jgi:hypothetical protein
MIESLSVGELQLDFRELIASRDGDVEREYVLEGEDVLRALESVRHACPDVKHKIDSMTDSTDCNDNSMVIR